MSSDILEVGEAVEVEEEAVEEAGEEAVVEEALEEAVPPPLKRRGRPVGSKHKVTIVPLEPPPEPEPQPAITRDPTAKRAPRKTHQF